MLSNKIVGNPNQAQHYFLGHDNYYTQDDELAKERSGWWGRGAESLGLSGPVENQQFLQLLKGQLPDGQQLGVKQGDEIKHRPGFDLTFSVPKSVSIVALLGEDPRILDAISHATDRALGLVEDPVHKHESRETALHHTKILINSLLLNLCMTYPEKRIPNCMSIVSS